MMCFRRGETITLKPAGGGGTNFVPIFPHLEREGVRPHSLIVLTDLLGSFPERGAGVPGDLGFDKVASRSLWSGWSRSKLRDQ